MQKIIIVLTFVLRKIGKKTAATRAVLLTPMSIGASPQTPLGGLTPMLYLGAYFEKEGKGTGGERRGREGERGEEGGSSSFALGRKEKSARHL